MDSRCLQIGELVDNGRESVVVRTTRKVRRSRTRAIRKARRSRQGEVGQVCAGHQNARQPTRDGRGFRAGTQDGGGSRGGLTAVIPRRLHLRVGGSRRQRTTSGRVEREPVASRSLGHRRHRVWGFGSVQGRTCPRPAGRGVGETPWAGLGCHQLAPGPAAPKSMTTKPARPHSQKPVGGFAIYCTREFRRACGRDAGKHLKIFRTSSRTRGQHPWKQPLPGRPASEGGCWGEPRLGGCTGGMRKSSLLCGWLEPCCFINLPLCCPTAREEEKRRRRRRRRSPPYHEW